MKMKIKVFLCLICLLSCLLGCTVSRPSVYLRFPELKEGAPCAVCGGEQGQMLYMCGARTGDEPWVSELRCPDCDVTYSVIQWERWEVENE